MSIFFFYFECVLKQKSNDSLVKTRGVGVFVLLYDGDDKGDEFRPKVQVFDAGTLFIWRYSLWLET